MRRAAGGGTVPCPYDTAILTIAHRAFVYQVSYFTPKDHIYSWGRCRTVVTSPRAQVLRWRVIPAGKSVIDILSST